MNPGRASRKQSVRFVIDNASQPLRGDPELRSPARFPRSKGPPLPWKTASRGKEGPSFTDPDYSAFHDRPPPERHAIAAARHTRLIRPRGRKRTAAARPRCPRHGVGLPGIGVMATYRLTHPMGAAICPHRRLRQTHTVGDHQDADQRTALRTRQPARASRQPSVRMQREARRNLRNGRSGNTRASLPAIR